MPDLTEAELRELDREIARLCGVILIDAGNAPLYFTVLVEPAPCHAAPWRATLWHPHESFDQA